MSGSSNIQEKEHACSNSVHEDEFEQDLQSQHDMTQREGLQAWLQLLGSFCLNLNTWGLMTSYGVFQTFYTLTLLRDSSTSAISWIGSLQAFLMFLVSFFIGPVFDAGHLRPLLFIGTVLSVVGFFLTSVCTKYWQCLLTQGVMMGLGFGCLYLPAPVLVAMYFAKNQALAIGIAGTGTGIGGIVFPLVFTRLEPRIGFGWATRVLACIVLVTSLIPLVIMQFPRQSQPSRKLSQACTISSAIEQRTPSQASTTRTDSLHITLHTLSNPAREPIHLIFARKFIDTSALKDRPYVVCNIALLASFMGLYIILYYVNLFTLERTSTNSDLASYMLLVVNAASVLGRTVPSALADKYGVGLVFTLAAAVSVILVFSILAVKTAAGMIVWCILFGIASGTLLGLPAAAVVSLSASNSRIGTRLGTTLGTVGCGVLVAEPIAGAILASPGGWPGLVGWCAGLLCLGCISMRVATVLKKDGKLKMSPISWKKLNCVGSVWL